MMFRLLQTLAGIPHPLSVHVLAFKQREVHFPEMVGEYEAHELRILQPVKFLTEKAALTVLV